MRKESPFRLSTTSRALGILATPFWGSSPPQLQLTSSEECLPPLHFHSRPETTGLTTFPETTGEAELSSFKGCWNVNPEFPHATAQRELTEEQGQLSDELRHGGREIRNDTARLLDLAVPEAIQHAIKLPSFLLHWFLVCIT